MVAQGITTGFYLTHPLDAINVMQGGLGIPGAVIGGGIALVWYCRRKKLSFAMWADIAAPSLALGQAIGRWGNYVNQEVYGRPSDLPWAITIDEMHRMPGFENVARYHPLFLYESLFNLLLMVLLIWMSRRFAGWLKQGDLFLIYLIGYPTARFFLEFLRLDAAQVGGINANQTLMAVVALTAAVLLVFRHRSQPEVAAE
jgi:phosphatidylglycerol:prolipoprotein diacylglycerol transferase